MAMRMSGKWSRVRLPNKQSDQVDLTLTNRPTPERVRDRKTEEDRGEPGVDQTFGFMKSWRFLGTSTIYDEVFWRYMR